MQSLQLFIFGAKSSKSYIKGEIKTFGISENIFEIDSLLINKLVFCKQRVKSRHTGSRRMWRFDRKKEGSSSDILKLQWDSYGLYILPSFR